MQKLLMITSHTNHPKFQEFPKRHGVVVDEPNEVKSLLEKGWKVVRIDPMNVPGNNSSYLYTFVVVLEKNW